MGVSHNFVKSPRIDDQLRGLTQWKQQGRDYSSQKPDIRNVRLSTSAKCLTNLDYLSRIFYTDVNDYVYCFIAGGSLYSVEPLLTGY
jgi:hypothetical protein